MQRQVKVSRRRCGGATLVTWSTAEYGLVVAAADAHDIALTTWARATLLAAAERERGEVTVPRAALATLVGVVEAAG